MARWKMNGEQLKDVDKTSLQKGNFPSDIDFTPEEADQFIDYIVDESVFKNNARIVRMDKSSKNIRSIGLGGGKILHPAGNFSKSANGKEEVSHEKLQLQSQKARGVVTVYDDDLEDNIEGDAFVDHLMQMIGRGVANELEYAYYWGVQRPDTANANTIEELWNGIRYQALRNSHSVEGSAVVLDAQDSGDFDLTNGYISEQNNSAPYNWEHKYHQMIKKLPSKFKKRGGGLGNFRLLNNDEVTMDYVQALTARGTAQGDAAITGGAPMQYGVTPIVDVPLMPTDVPVPVSGTHGDTTIDSAVSAGDTTISVASESNFAADDVVCIYRNTPLMTDWDAEIGVVASTDTGQITLDNGVTYDHAGDGSVNMEEVTQNGTESILTQYQNIVLGIQRDVSIETERDAPNEATNFWFSLRTDLLVECVAAMTVLRNLKVR